MHLNLEQSSDGTVLGTYSSSLGGVGDLLGRFWGTEGKLELRQKSEGCEGTFKAILRAKGESLVGDYVGDDCLGIHFDGRFTLVPGHVQPEGLALVYGTINELRYAKQFHLTALEEYSDEREVIRRVLESNKLELVDNPLKADVLLGYGPLAGTITLRAGRVAWRAKELRIVWYCRDWPDNVNNIRKAEYCAQKFLTAYNEARRE